MPTILRIGGIRFFFYSKEGTEPAHIHVEQADNVAKFWLDPVELESSYGFSAKEINQIRKLVVEYQATFLQAWHDYFN
ncbi:DUF4160 domain-containing protein [Spirosoma sp. HMF4905]|uniref:DUF4160 domain-containing protein n=1 Tax=Spirosoma arboris TaxID=2682092 RepID=A0A7K1SLQ9_9BACT|nr:DUF4160 domain-containing protein [Spirosoma arboris]MVM34516.1 DUF4160 domain-containing protein [Spirosoma arboris]